MRRFYGNLRLGHDKAEALTMAERELLKMYGAEHTDPMSTGLVAI
jgi:CHAT domain-containing protein